MKVTIQDSRTSVTVEPRDFKVTVSGARGPQGEPGAGSTPGGTTGQILAKASAADYDTEWIDNFAPNVEVYVKNSSGSAMTKGQIVYISGADGTHPTVSLAIASTEMGSSKTIGWLKQNLANGDLGYVVTEGLLEGLNTNGAGAAGDPIWLSPTTAGGVVYGLSNKPSAPNHMVFLGYVLRKQTNNGKVYVKVQNGFELGELHDVYDGAKTTPVSADTLLLRDSADSNLWKRLTWANAMVGVKAHMDTYKGVAGGYASLDGGGKIPSTELPSYVDDVVEVANYAALPATGETGKIYVTLDTNKCYRWTGSVYVEVSAGGASAWGAITGTLSSQTDLQTALDGKVDENAAITGATKTKITYDAKGLVTAGSDAGIADITGLQTALNGKQATVTLTTIGTSGAATLVGSTLNIPQYQSVLTNPVTGIGTSGQVAYFNGTSSVTGSSNLFWDGANGMLGVGTNAPAYGVDTNTFRVTSTGMSTFYSFNVQRLQFNNGSTNTNWGYIYGTSNGVIRLLNSAENDFDRLSFGGGTASFPSIGKGTSTNSLHILDAAAGVTTNLAIGLTQATTPSARLHVRGSGTTSSTTALLVQNSTPTELFKVADNGDGNISGDFTLIDGKSLRLSSRANFFDGGGRATFNTNQGSNALGYALTIIASGLNQSSGTGGILNYAPTINPTSGTGIFILHNIAPTINQTGGANGITRGLFVNPTLTSAADWRGIESVAASNANHTLIKLRNATVDVFTVKADSKIGFFNAAPVAQPTTGITEATFVENSGGDVVNVDSTFAGYTIQQIAQALKDLGLLS